MPKGQKPKNKTFRTDKESTGAVVVTRRGSDYDSGNRATNVNSSAVMKRLIQKGKPSLAISSSKDWAKSVKKKKK